MIRAQAGLLVCYEALPEFITLMLMNGVMDNNFLKWLLRARWLHHLLFWLLLFGRTYSSIYKAFELTYTLWYCSIYIGVYAVQVYINLYFLYPRFFLKGKFLSYLIYVTILIAAGTYVTLEVFISVLQLSKATYFNLFFNTLIIQAVATGAKFFKEGIRNYFTIQELKTAQQDAEVHALRAQINPHFLFNTLNNLYSLTLKNSSQAPEVVLKLSELMRYMTQAIGKSEVNLEDESRHIERYIDLEKLRLNPGAEITFYSQGVLSSRKIAPLLLLPLVENAFKHGVETQSENVKVSVELTLQHDQLFFVVINTKPRVKSENELDNSSGTGITNLRRRLELAYPGMHEFSIDNDHETFSARLWIKFP